MKSDSNVHWSGSADGERPVRAWLPLRADVFRLEVELIVGWYNETRPHMMLGGRTPNEVCFHRFPANRTPRFEPRERWPRGSPCAKPWALVKGKAGMRWELEVEFHHGRRHLPILRLKRGALQTRGARRQRQRSQSARAAAAGLLHSRPPSVLPKTVRLAFTHEPPRVQSAQVFSPTTNSHMSTQDSLGSRQIVWCFSVNDRVHLDQNDFGGEPTSVAQLTADIEVDPGLVHAGTVFEAEIEVFPVELIGEVLHAA